jgi:hypothetical protein
MRILKLFGLMHNLSRELMTFECYLADNLSISIDKRDIDTNYNTKS